MKVTYVLTHTYSLLGIKSILPMQVLESLATFLPSGQTQIPPSSEDRHSCSHPSDEQRVVAGKKRIKCQKCSSWLDIFSLKHIIPSPRGYVNNLYRQLSSDLMVN